VSFSADSGVGTTIDAFTGVRRNEDTMTRTLSIASLSLLVALGAPVALSAQPAIVLAQWGSNNSYQRSYDDGYRSGLREGERDARAARRPDYRLHDEYRRGSNGGNWNNSGWNGQASGDVFRRGFAEGYTSGYQRFSRSYGRQTYPDYGDAYRYPGSGYGRSQYPQYPQYPQGQGGYGYPGSGYGGSPAGQRGFEDGYRAGRDDARDNDRYETTRKKDYRDGDDGYNSRYGPREQYRAEYRQAFQQGYDRGYREGRYR